MLASARNSASWTREKYSQSSARFSDMPFIYCIVAVVVGVAVSFVLVDVL